jgi:MATE family multidrug resistance protein
MNRAGAGTADTPATATVGVAPETRRLFHLALPLMGAQLAQMGMGVVDTIMAGRYSAVDLAGVALGGSIFWPVLMLVMGLVQAVTPTVSQLNGARRYGEIGEVIRQGLWLGLGGGLVAAVLLTQIGPVYAWMSVDPAAAAVSVPYLRMCALGVPALMCFFCLRFLADGTGHTRPALLIAICALLLKVPLNYVLIHGKLGLPALGGVGCGVAQAILMWVQLGLILLVVTRRRFDFTGWRARFSAPDWRRVKPLLIVGIPIGATIFAEMGLFALTTLLLGRFGADVVASHNIAMNINGVLFMPAMALGMASTIRIGFRVGAGELIEARMTAAIAIGTCVTVALAGALLIFVAREPLVALYTTEASVHDLASTLLLFVVVFLLFDALQATALGALRGYKDTRVPMFIALFSYWVVGLPLECALGFGWFGAPLGVYGFWIGLGAGVGVAALLLNLRLWRLSGSVGRIRALSPD